MRQETHEILCVLLEDAASRERPPDVESLADAILVALERFGEDILEHLDPPLGLRRWLESHGLSLVPTTEVTPPRIWDVLAEEEDEEIEVAEAPRVAVGDHVQYETAPHGPRGQSQIGAGTVTAVRQSEGGLVVTVRNGLDLTHLLLGEGDRVSVTSSS